MPRGAASRNEEWPRTLRLCPHRGEPHASFFRNNSNNDGNRSTSAPLDSGNSSSHHHMRRGGTPPHRREESCGEEDPATITSTTTTTATAAGVLIDIFGEEEASDGGTAPDGGELLNGDDLPPLNRIMMEAMAMSAAAAPFYRIPSGDVLQRWFQYISLAFAVLSGGALVSVSAYDVFTIVYHLREMCRHCRPAKRALHLLNVWNAVRCAVRRGRTRRRLLRWSVKAASLSGHVAGDGTVPTAAQRVVRSATAIAAAGKLQWCKQKARSNREAYHRVLCRLWCGARTKTRARGNNGGAEDDNGEERWGSAGRLLRAAGKRSGGAWKLFRRVLRRAVPRRPPRRVPRLPSPPPRLDGQAETSDHRELDDDARMENRRSRTRGVAEGIVKSLRGGYAFLGSLRRAAPSPPPPIASASGKRDVELCEGACG